MTRMLLALCIAFAVTGAAAQDAFVQSSNIALIQPAQTMACGDVLILPAGAIVRLIDSQGNSIERTGPYEGPAIPCGGQASSTIKRLFSLASRDEYFRSMGAVRAGPAKALSTCSAASKAKAVLDIEADTTYCAPANGPLPCLYVRPNAGLNRFALSAAGGDVATVQLAEGQTQVEWPKSLPFKPGLAYTVAAADEPQVNIFTVVAMPKGTGRDLVLAMADKGCERQAAQALLELK
jgi:hypothetical protein